MDTEERPRKKARTSSLTHTIGDLLSTGKYSDLEIRCDGRSFKVHRNIVCGRSIVMDKECDGAFIEARTRIIKHSVFDSLAMDRMLQFMYRSDYQVKPVCPTSADPDANYEPASESESLTPPTTTEGLAVVESVEGQDDDYIVAHVYVYAIADYYELPALQDLAVEKFKKSMSNWRSNGAEDFIELASIVYTNTTKEAEALRDQTFRLIWEHPLSTFDSQTFMDALATRPELQELAADMVAKTTTLHRSSEHGLKVKAKTLQLSVYEHKAAEIEKAIIIEERDDELELRNRDIADLIHFSNIDFCTKCESLGHAARPFTYNISPRSRDNGYAAKCTHCNKKYVRPE